tara:strand:- start:9185 stop:10246 length:1062 start_codon:yes stop_codon:yes gene_type:complete
MKKKNNIFRIPWNSQSRSSKKLWLDKNENNDSFLKGIHSNIKKKIKLSDISAYPDLTETYKNLSKFLKVSKNKIFLTAGSDLAIKSIFETFLSPGNKVLTTNPTYAMYSIYCKIFRVKNILLNYQYKKNGPYLDVEKFILKIKKNRPKLVCIPNPDSPTGQVISKKNLERIIKIAQKNKGLVLIDEAYYLFYKSSVINFIDRYKNLILIRSASKAMGIAGLRVGIMISNPNIISQVFMYKPMYEISSIGNLFIKEIIKVNNYKLIKKSVNRLNEGKIYFIKHLKKNNINYFNSYANFIHVDFGPSKKKILSDLQKKIYFRLEEKHKSMKGFSRISLTSKKNFKIIKKIIDKYI